MSKTIKIIARRKNRIEKGIRAEWLGSNPHSKGDSFSRSLLDRIDTTNVISRIIIGNIKETEKIIIINSIILTLINFLWLKVTRFI